MSISTERLRSLVEPTRVHRDIYVDPAIFELEMERIFGRTWVFVGHESQVPKPGDFFATRIGLQPVVLTRNRDGKVKVIHNRCAHRGAKVVTEESGNAHFFRCLYHGWAYNVDGSLASVPLPEDFPPECDLKDPRYGMGNVQRVETYRGFVFANLSSDGPDLKTYLGEAASALDDLVDASPEGEVEFAGGCHRYVYEGNWKHQTDNLTDTYHTIATHASTVEEDGQQFKRAHGEDGGKAEFYDSADEQKILVQLGLYTFVNGHCACDSMLPEEPHGGIVDEYRAMLVKKHGEERTREVMRQKYHNFFIYPNCDLLFVQNSIRVVIPLAVDRTEIRIYPLRLKGAPEQIFQDHIKYVNRTHSASSFVQSDDVEAFRRIQDGLASTANPWNVMLRGVGDEKYNNRGIGYGRRSSEIATRFHAKTWLDLMCAE